MTLDLSLLGKLLLANTDLKRLALDEAKALVRAKAQDHLTPAVISRIAGQMTRDGFTWAGTGKVASIPDEGLGRGFVLSRDALYRIIKSFGVRGGVVVDAWRDATDNTVWNRVCVLHFPDGTTPEGTPLEDLVRWTGAAFVDTVL